MILLVGVVAGALFGTIRAKIYKLPYKAVEINHIWLVLAAYLPQFFAFNLRATRRLITDQWISIMLILSQVLLLIFIWINRKIPGGWLMGLGLALNFLVIILNGGMMPLTPENAQYLLPKGSSITFTLGERVGATKDILLEKMDTTLWFLGDIFQMPKWLNYAVVFSLGDILLSVGAFWLFWDLGNPKNNLETVTI